MSKARVDKGTVVLVDIPYLNAMQSVRRPALIVSDASQLLDVIVAGITSRIRTPLPPTHFVIDNNHPDWRSSGLRLVSAVRCDRLFTVEPSAIQRVLGQLSPATILEIDKRLKLVMGIS
jgi:mRNA interferase MazF